MSPGGVLLCALDPTVGREQGGRRPVVVVSAPEYAVIPGLLLAVPLTSIDRGLRHHVAVPADEWTGLRRGSYAMTEQVRVLSRQRVRQRIGAVDGATLREIAWCIRNFLVRA